MANRLKQPWLQITCEKCRARWEIDGKLSKELIEHLSTCKTCGKRGRHVATDYY